MAISTEPWRKPSDKERDALRAIGEVFENLGQQHRDPTELFQKLLVSAYNLVKAEAAAVWLNTADGRPRVEFALNLEKTRLQERVDDEQQHLRMLERIVERPRREFVAPHSNLADEPDAGNPTDFLVLLVPIIVGRRPEGLLEFFVPAALLANAAQLLSWAGEAGEAAENLLSEQGWRILTDRQATWAKLEGFARAVHRSLNVREISFTLANDGRRVLGCDRVSVAVGKSHDCRVAAVSGQDVMDQRSNLIQRLRKLAETVTRSGDEVWFTGDEGNLPPQVVEALHEYLREAHSKVIGVFPLRRPAAADESLATDEAAPSEVLGALVVEQFGRPLPEAEFQGCAAVVAAHGGTALANAIEHRSLFLLPVWRALGKFRNKVVRLLRGRHRAKVIIGCALPLLLLAALFIVPADFEVESRGALQPVTRREVFADIDGVVENVFVEHGQSIAAGATLVELKSTDLNVTIAGTKGQWRATLAQIDAVERVRSEGRTTAEESIRLSGQLAQLHAARRGLEQQLQIYEQKEARLKVASPIDGQVISWQVRDRLINRPVQRGQSLLTVANSEGEWELELRVPEQHIAHLVRGQQELGNELRVRYVLASTPGRSHEGTIRAVHTTADVHGDEENTVLVRVKIRKNELSPEELRPGVTVTAKVHCGRTSLGYSYLHDVIGWLQRQWFKW